MGFWSLIIVMFLFSQKYDILSNTYIYLGISLIALFLKGINEIYMSDDLEKFLGTIELLIFSIKKIIFYLRYYVIFSTFLVLEISKWLLGNNYYVSISILCLGALYHIISQSKNSFYCESFVKLKEKLSFNFNIECEENVKSFFELECVKFFLFVEDKYFLQRKKVYSTIPIILKYKIKLSINKLKGQRNKYKFKNFNNIKKAKKCNQVNLWRGYSNIEQQLVRTQVMVDNSYKYKYRRKIFVEYTYTSLFFKAIRNQNKKYHRDNELILKREIVKSYFNLIYGISLKNLNPIPIDDLINKMNEQSDKDIKALYDKFKIR